MRTQVAPIHATDAIDMLTTAGLVGMLLAVIAAVKSTPWQWLPPAYVPGLTMPLVIVSALALAAAVVIHFTARSDA